MFATITRILHGDFIWFALGGGASVLFSLPALFIQTKWVKVILFAALAVCGMLVSHYAFESFMAWYQTPLGPALQIVK